MRSVPADVSRLRHDGDCNTVPGEHDTTRVCGPHGDGIFTRSAKKPPAIQGVLQLDHGGVHFIGPDQRLTFKPGGLGTLGGGFNRLVTADP